MEHQRQKEYIPFKIHAPYKPTGDQPEAIDQIVEGLKENKRVQVLLGATGTGKTFTMANVIEKTQRPALVLVHNKTLAGQLYAEFKELFPENRVEYFISNFDFYRPEAYLPKTDTYIDKEAVINEEIEMMRSSAVNSILSRKDTIVVASVASIFGLTDPDEYEDLAFDLRVGEVIDMRKTMAKLVDAQYSRNNMSIAPGSFRLQGNMLEIAPYNMTDACLRVYVDEDSKIEEMDEVRLTTGELLRSVEYYMVFPADEHASGYERIKAACVRIREELTERLHYFHQEGKLLEEERLDMRTRHDVEALEEFGTVAGIENYSRHIEGREKGEPPFCLLDYLDKDFLLFVDESHVTIPQVFGMYNGDQARKQVLVDYGFRLPSALDNRPLRFEEFFAKIKNMICTSATPGDWELEQTKGQFVEQIIRPTGLLDPSIEVRSNMNNPVYDVLNEIQQRIKLNERVIVCTLTIDDAENLTDFFKQKGIKVAYLQHEIKTLERSEIIYKLRKGDYDCVVGINLLREGLDLPEVSLIAILDADKEGFLRSTRSLIQLTGRAARNDHGKVIMYADSLTKSMKETIDETDRRRSIQDQFNKEHNITPKSIVKPIVPPVRLIDKKKPVDILAKDGKLTKSETLRLVAELEKEMRKAASELDFERAAELRDSLLELKASLA
jgi:excinuclease ABC subunit B